MKLLFILASLFAASHALFSVGAPPIISPGQKVNIEIIALPSTPAREEISLAIGIVPCVGGTCPDPRDDLGKTIFIGKFQGVFNISASALFQDFRPTVPSSMSGDASIQVQRVSLTPSAALMVPTIEYSSVRVTLRSPGLPALNIHPNGDNAKCIGIFGGVYANGRAVDIYDCNKSKTQKWQFNGNVLTSVSPDGTQWCLDAGVRSNWAKGVKMKIWQCIYTLPQQSWIPIATSGPIELTMDNFCLDLTGGSKMNRNILQIWDCNGGKNQHWTVTSAA